MVGENLVMPPRSLLVCSGLSTLPLRLWEATVVLDLGVVRSMIELVNGGGAIAVS